MIGAAGSGLRPEVELRHAWLQKHATPAADEGEFHWFPREGDRELRAACVDRMRGVEPPAVIWELAPGRVVWARPFAAIAPDDGRRYVGLVLTIAELAGATPADLLDALTLPPAAPWIDAESRFERRVSAARDADTRERSASTRGAIGNAANANVRERTVAAAQGPNGDAGARERSASATQDAVSSAARERLPVMRGGDAASAFAPDVDVAAIARVLLSGGVARVGDPASSELPAAIASLDRCMPEPIVARVRRGTWSAGTGPSPVADRAASVVVEAWRAPSSHAGRAWRLLVELANARDEHVDEVLAGSRDAMRGALTDEERAALPSARELVDVLHAWGRGRLDQCPTAGDLTERLADAVALRMLAQLVDGRDAESVLAEARWHALLPAARRTTLLETIAARAGSLRGLVEVGDA